MDSAWDLARRLPEPVKKVLRPLAPMRRKRHWQEVRSEGTRQRWELISDALGSDDRTLLDVGCNTGLLTLAAADHGMFALGIDKMPEAVDSARDLAAGRERVAFMHLELTRDDLEALPTFDVVLFLSVYHQWVANLGDQVAREMLGVLASKARSRFFFEPAAIRSKYGSEPPPISDLDEHSIVEVNTQLLQQAVGAEVRYLGSTPAVNEAFRCLFMVQR